ASVTIAAFVVTTLVGEFLYLPQAGYTLQGRYFLPVGLLLATLVTGHDVPLARRALVGCAIMLAVLLANRTVHRYYEEGWRGVREGLPFVSRASSTAS